MYEMPPRNNVVDDVETKYIKHISNLANSDWTTYAAFVFPSDSDESRQKPMKFCGGIIQIKFV